MIMFCDIMLPTESEIKAISSDLVDTGMHGSIAKILCKSKII